MAELHDISGKQTLKEAWPLIEANEIKLNEEMLNVQAEFNEIRGSENSRKFNETTRQENETERIEAETEREETELIRLANEESRISAENQRATDTSDRLGAMDAAVNTTKFNYLTPVANYVAIATTYTTPAIGDVVQTVDDGKFFRWDGTAWEHKQTLNTTQITQLSNDIGIKSNLTTSDKSSLVGSVNEVNALLAETGSQIGIKAPASFSDLSLYIVGDSTSDAKNTYTADTSPTIALHDRLDRNWISPGKPLEGARRFAFAQGGQTLLDFLQNVNAGAGIDDLIAKANDATESKRLKVVVFCLGINGSPTWANFNTRLAEMRTAMGRILTETDCQVLLRMPNVRMVSELITVELSQEYEDVLGTIYKQIANEYPRTQLIDVPTVLGKGAYAQTPWTSGQAVTAGNFRFTSDRATTLLGNANVYKALTSGTTGATAPSGTGTSISDGAVTWEYVGLLNPYMADQTHMNKLGYEIIADLIGESVLNMFASIKPNPYMYKYLGKPFSEYRYQASEPNDIPVISGELVKKTSTKLIVDMDYEKAKFKVQYADMIKPYGNLGLSIATTDKIERPTTRLPSTAYAVGDIVSATDQYDNSITLECIDPGTTAVTTTVTVPVDHRFTEIIDSGVVWVLLARYHMTQLPYNNAVSIPRGVTVSVYRPAELTRTVRSALINSGQFLKIATVRIYTTFSDVNLFFNIITLGDNIPDFTEVNIAVTQSGGWAVSNIVDKAVAFPKARPSTNFIAASDIAVVTTKLSTGYREVEVYLKNSTTVGRRYIIQGLGGVNKDQNTTGSQKPYVEFFPAPEADVAALPTEFAGTTNTVGQYNQEIYIGSPDGSLWKMTIDNAGVVTYTKV